jgi:hypothetical protein
MEMSVDTFRPDNLLVGGPVRTQPRVIASGQNLARGSVLGIVKFSCPTTGTAGTNTGNGTVTLVKAGSLLKIGTYTLTVTEVAATFILAKVTDPDGKSLGNVAMGTGDNDTGEFSSEQIQFLVTNGTTDFAAADSFTITVTEGVPNTATVTGTGNGTCPQIEGRRGTRAQTYKIQCVTAIAGGGKFNLLDASSNALATIYASKYVGTGTGALTEIKAGPRFKKNGPYLIKCTTAVTNGGVFTVTDPDGTVIGTATIPPGSTNSITFDHEQISFKVADATDFAENDLFTLYWNENDYLACVIWDGSSDFIVGDYFSVAVTIGQNQCKLVNYENTDGSNEADCVLSHDVDATSAAKECICYTEGVFDERELRFGGNDTIDSHRATMRIKGLKTVSSMAA